ncbi:MAG: PHP domain-containing protein [Methanomassiliicoccus sp.]|nr:PHP domain-containing protein [Methanomassiliicoccus sp.]
MVMNDGIFRERITAERIAEEGPTAVDMHFHTNHSDSHTTVTSALRRAKRLGLGVAITDHNTISGSEEAYRAGSGTLIVPGIEVSAADGPHILLYFYDLDNLREYYEKHVRPFKRSSPYLAIELDSWDIVRRSEGYNCVRVAAHPYGYLLFNKGLQKCIEARYLEQEILEHFDGIEVMCGGMTRKLNDKAAALAERFLKGRTGGTDGHLLHDLGNVVTVGPSDDLDGFLGDVVERRTRAIGREKTTVQKTVMGSVVMTKYIRYTIPSLRIHYEQNAPRALRFLRDLRSRGR